MPPPSGAARRAPGHAPVFDPCGMAGGGPQKEGGEAKYIATAFAKQGDLGSKVRKTRSWPRSWANCSPL